MPALPVLTKDADLKAVRTAVVDAAKTLIELRSTPADKRGDTHVADVKETIDFLHDGDLLEKALLAGQRQADADAKAELDKRNKGRGGRSLGAELDDVERRSYGAQVVESEAYEQWVKEGRQGSLTVETRALLGEWPSGDALHTGADIWLPVGQPVLHTPSLQRRRFFIRDLVSVQQTGLASVPYMQELNAVANEGGAQMVAEGSAKPEVTMEFVAADAQVRKIAAWIPVTDEIIADAPTLRGYIDTRLEYMVNVRAEQQELNGTGTAPQIRGILQTVGIQTQAAVTGDYPATIAAAIGKVENVDGDADGVATNPIDYWTAVAKRHADQFDNGFGGNAPSAMSGITWGLPAVRTRALSSGDAVVGAWRLGATLFDRSGLEIKVADQHSTNFIENILVIRGERREALAVWVPPYFVDTTVPTS